MKTRMITRTIKTTVIRALYLNVDTEQTEEKLDVLPGEYKNAEKILAELKKLDTDKKKVVFVKEYHVEPDKYGMTEADFLAAAKPIA